ncbi:hypothetical protein PTTG_28842 [Puccinia triticina 1-1 BBBD Race 1]|uniref:CCHC-type domain-containing protein n=1 Tax=Puccinia triticina (isolate 1-1 / race 1 (BBBD)) TaxID=630390 RepID=A0A180G952_PUCT1|nr:hypothetical protein PTTG_28842 [Puccinia triticina 1-1 BBBD Race 1]
MSEIVTQTTRFLLTTTNYTVWKLSIEAKLHDLGFREYVIGTWDLTDKNSADNHAKAAKLNGKAYSLIIQNLDSDNLALDQFNRRALWTLLKDKYAGTNFIDRSVALDNFLDVEYKDIPSFCSAIRLANQKMVLAGVLDDDQVKMMLMLRQLPQHQFKSFRDVVTMTCAEESFEDIVKKLETYKVTSMKNEGSINTQSTLHTRAQVNTKSLNLKTCIHCDKPGHQPANCWVKYPEKAPKTAAAHITMQDNFNQLDTNDPTDFSYFRTADGVRHHINEIRYEGVNYH